MKWVLDAVDCLLIMESLKEDSLMEDEVHSFRGAGDRKRRQGNLSARVILGKRAASTRTRLRFWAVAQRRAQEKQKQNATLTCICCV